MHAHFQVHEKLCSVSNSHDKKCHFLQKSMSGSRCERILAVIWNFIALYLVLSLCILSWYSRLYTSWACVTDSNDILLFCQFTNQVIIALSTMAPPPLSVAILFLLDSVLSL